MIHRSFADRLLGELLGDWPLKREEHYHHLIDFYRAHQKGDHHTLKPTGWGTDYEGTRAFLVDPLGKRIPKVWRDLLFGESPGIAPASKNDRARMDELKRFNHLGSRLKRAATRCSAEGEAWYRETWNDAMGHAELTFHSRKTVAPLWIGEHLMAAAFVTPLEVKGKDKWTYVEVHAEGIVLYRLFKGQKDNPKLGDIVALGSHTVTADLDDEWEHGLPMLCGRIVNELEDDYHFGVSDYEGLTDLLDALNEQTTVAQENFRLTAKQRAIVPQRFLNLAGNFPTGQEILVATEVDQDPEKIKNEVGMIEFSFDATAVIAYKDHTTDTILTRARIAPQLVGRHTEGAQTGPAMRARLIDSELALQGKGKEWDEANPEMFQKLMLVEKARGVSWSNVRDLPSFKRASALPEDPESRVRGLAIAVNAEFLSRKTAITKANPEWDETRVDEEMDQIEKELEMGQVEMPDSTNDPSSLRTPATEKVPATKDPKPETGGEKVERRNA